MTLKDILIEKLGEDKAKEILSEHGRNMRASVKKPYVFNSETAKKAAAARWKKNENKDTSTAS